MSKSPNIFIPALGGTALVLGLAYGLWSRDYGARQIASLESRFEAVSDRASIAAEQVQAEAARAAELEQKIASIQAEAAERVSGDAGLTAPAPTTDSAFGIGRPALPEEVAAWDVDVLPDGRGLPDGSGDVLTGEEVFAEKCASCHGDFAEGVDNWPVLAGGFDTLGDKDPVKTVGSYWPYLSTAWDYIHRSMPFGEAGTLSADETYAIVAYILYSNDLVDDAFELTRENFADFDMYNMEGFVIDDRPELEYALWRKEPCMENCKDQVDVTMRSVFLVETPPEGGSNSIMNHAASEALPSFTAAGPSFVPEAVAQPSPKVEEAAVVQGDENLIATGEKVFRKCKSCHQIGDGAKNRTGPQLNGVMGRAFGAADGFAYSGAFKAAAEAGRIWSDEEMAAFLANPKQHLKGTKMSFSGLRDDSDIAAMIAYLKSFGG
jgi:cytochrome c